MFNILYAAIYSGYKEAGEWSPRASTTGLISIGQFLYLLLADSTITKITNKDLFHAEYSNELCLIIAGVLVIINSLYFNRERIDKIVFIYAGKSDNQKVIIRAFSALFFVFPILGMVCVYKFL